MPNIANIIDLSLYGVLALTVAIVAYKSVELYFPKALKLPGFPASLGSSENELQEGMEHLERGLTLLAVIASTAPFLGLVGTALHIVEALRGMGSGAGDISVISGPIATALYSTLVGLASAIPSAVAHSFMLRRLQLIESRHRRSRSAQHAECSIGA
jgi:hypothetical protein